MAKRKNSQEEVPYRQPAGPTSGTTLPAAEGECPHEEREPTNFFYNENATPAAHGGKEKVEGAAVGRGSKSNYCLLTGWWKGWCWLSRHPWGTGRRRKWGPTRGSGAARQPVRGGLIGVARGDRALTLPCPTRIYTVYVHHAFGRLKSAASGCPSLLPGQSVWHAVQPLVPGRGRLK